MNWPKVNCGGGDRMETEIERCCGKESLSGWGRMGYDQLCQIKHLLENTLFFLNNN